MARIQSDRDTDNNNDSWHSNNLHVRQEVKNVLDKGDELMRCIRMCRELETPGDANVFPENGDVQQVELSRRIRFVLFIFLLIENNQWRI